MFSVYNFRAHLNFFWRLCLLLGGAFRSFNFCYELVKMILSLSRWFLLCSSSCLRFSSLKSWAAFGHGILLSSGKNVITRWRSISWFGCGALLIFCFFESTTGRLGCWRLLWSCWFATGLIRGSTGLDCWRTGLFCYLSWTFRRIPKTLFGTCSSGRVLPIPKKRSKVVATFYISCAIVGFSRNLFILLWVNL